MAKKPIIKSDTDIPASHVRADATGITGLLGRGRAKAKNATPANPDPIVATVDDSPEAAAPAPSPAAPAKPAKMPLGPRTDIKLLKADHRELEQLLDRIEETFGWKPKRTEIGEALFMMLLHTKPVFDRMPDVPETTRPAYHTHEARRDGILQLAAFLNRAIRDAEVMMP